MKKYSISQVAKKLNISRDTLRYYDKLGLVCPVRGDNRYRYYSEEDVSRLMYIRVMKFAGFSLDEVQMVFRNMNAVQCDRREDTLVLFDARAHAIQDKISRLQESLELITLSAERIREKTSLQEITELVTAIYGRIEHFD